MTYFWDDDRREYVDDETGEALLITSLIAIRNSLSEAAKADMKLVSARLAGGEITIQEWVLEMRELIEGAFEAGYVLGRGGYDQMGDGDWEELGQLVQDQWVFLQLFAGELVGGDIGVARLLQPGGAVWGGGSAVV